MELGGIGKWFDGKEVIGEVDVSMKNGELVRVVGGCGWGKRRVVGVIGGVESVDWGGMMVDKEEMREVGGEKGYVKSVLER